MKEICDKVYSLVVLEGEILTTRARRSSNLLHAEQYIVEFEK
jgi:hypothetical protein